MTPEETKDYFPDTFRKDEAQTSLPNLVGSEPASQDSFTQGEWKAGGNGVHVKTSCVAIAYDPSGERMTDTTLANARLIAASPDLLKACRAILNEPYGCSLCDSGTPRNEAKGHQPGCPFETARAAIAKVTGNK